MKKLLFTLSIILIFISCYTTGTVWDPSVPPEESVKILFWGFDATVYNGIDVDKKSFRIINIPAETSSFSGDMVWEKQYFFGNTKIVYQFKENNASFSCNFEAGKEYYVLVSGDESEENQCVWGISLYEGKIKAVFMEPPGDFITFIPFDPPIITPPKSEWTRKNIFSNLYTP